MQSCGWSVAQKNTCLLFILIRDGVICTTSSHAYAHPILVNFLAYPTPRLQNTPVAKDLGTKKTQQSPSPIPQSPVTWQGTISLPFISYHHFTTQLATPLLKKAVCMTTHEPSPLRLCSSILGFLGVYLAADNYPEDGWEGWRKCALKRDDSKEARDSLIACTSS